MSAHGGTVECHCLMQVIRGAESVALPYGDDIHNVLRQYRAQCSTNSKPAPEPPGTDSECSNCSPVLREAFAAATAADKLHMSIAACLDPVPCNSIAGWTVLLQLRDRCLQICSMCCLPDTKVTGCAACVTGSLVTNQVNALVQLYCMGLVHVDKCMLEATLRWV